MGSEYYTAKEREAVEIFRKVEAYITFLDITSLEAKGADIESRLEREQDRYQKLQEQTALMMAYMMEKDPKKKEAIARELIEKEGRK